MVLLVAQVRELVVAESHSLISSAIDMLDLAINFEPELEAITEISLRQVLLTVLSYPGDEPLLELTGYCDGCGLRPARRRKPKLDKISF